MIGISPSSMVKYELPENEGGKIPSAPNLVKICEHLEIDPREAFDAIQLGRLAQEELESEEPRSWPPKSKDYFRFTDFFASDADWMKFEYNIKSIEDLHQNLAQIGGELHWLNSKVERINTVLEGKDPSEEAQKEHEEFRARMEKAKAEYLSGGIENGPDQKDPSRSALSSTETEAVDAASTEQTKGKAP
ncbi:helix-turn-helix transcriptional regulator [Magnetovibrio sp.]|uniref:helix-turn-helix domain-containing protein n=1 Tax=Magnetovibrio sp. TaxID=2024836 RepID=UPI002F932D07